MTPEAFLHHFCQMTKNKVRVHDAMFWTGSQVGGREREAHSIINLSPYLKVGMMSFPKNPGWVCSHQIKIASVKKKGHFVSMSCESFSSI